MSDHRELPPPTAPKPKPEPEHFRRRQFVAPHRRRKLIFRLAGPFLAAVAVVGLPSAVVGWVALSDQFTVRSVTVASGDRVSMSWAAVGKSGDQLASRSNSTGMFIYFRMGDGAGG